MSENPNPIPDAQPGVGPRPRPLLLAVAFLAFVSIGVPDAVLGVAWPSIRQTFDLPVSHLGQLLLTATIGYLISCFYGGALIDRFGVGRILLFSSLAIVMVAANFALAGWWAIVAVGLLSGLGSGAIDAGLNVYAARHFSPRVMNWIHACYGVGASAGPLMMSSVIVAGLSWRWGYVGVAALLAVMSACFLLTLRLWEDGTNAGATPTPDPGTELLTRTQAMRRPLVWMHTGLFFAYAGVEATTGQWAYSLLTEGRGMSPRLAGAAASIFWIGLTAGRIGFGQLSSRVASDAILRATMLACPIAAALLWLNLSPAADVAALALLGLACAPIFPLLVSVTPVRVGDAHASHTIGFQVAAAYLGIAGIPGLTGILARWSGLEVIPVVITVSGVATLLLHEVVLRRVRDEAPAAHASTAA